VYVLYVAVFATDFLRVKFQRRTHSLFLDMLVRRGVYMPNEIPREMREAQLSTAPPGVRSHFPLPAMMLSRPPSLDWVTMGVRTRAPPRFLQLLEDEEAVMRAKGMSRWMPPRDEFVPLGGEMTEERRQREFMASWARPLSEDDLAKGFADFFESLENDAEYGYDPESEEWVFNKDSEWVTGATRDGRQDGDGNVDADAVVRKRPTFEIRFPDMDDADTGTVV
jgi:hypothetical protein